jgi:polysaccharide export outer membrane protein
MCTWRFVHTVLLGLLVCGIAPAVAAQEYIIGPRDVLRVTVWGHEDLSKEYPVGTDGFVPFPLIGRARAAGLTAQQFAAQLRELLEKDYLVNPQVIVAVSQYLSKKVHVLGETERAGSFYLTGPTTVLEIVSKAGLGKSAGHEILVLRKASPVAGGNSPGSIIMRLDLRKIQSGDTTENIALEDEDTVFIPKGQAFFVLGEVKNAGTFALDKPTSALEAITLAGGFNERAAPSGAKIIRKAADGRQETISLDLSGAVPKDGDVTVQSGDTLLVPKGNTFFVFGEVRKPGSYQLDKGTNVLEGITLAGGFTDKAAPGRVRVIRNTTTGQRVIEIDVNDIIKRGNRDKAIALQENDVVVVPESFF